MKRLWSLLALPLFFVAFIATCSPRPGSEALDMVQAIGDLAAAGADALGFDMSVRDAAAAPPLVADCNKTWTRTMGQSITTNYYAEFAVAGLDVTTLPPTTAWICDPTDGLGNSISAFDLTVGGCAMGYQCDASVLAACMQALGTIASGGIIRIGCGYSVTINGTKQLYPWKFAKAYLKVGQ